MEILQRVIETVQTCSIAFSKYITANDTGATGGHQAGYHIHKNAWQLFFEKEGEKGTNKEKFVTIKWNDDFETTSRFIYYGKGTRNEYRLTRFGRGFPYLQDDCIGDLLVLCKRKEDYYDAFVLQSDDDIEDFFAELNLTSLNTNCIIPKQFERTSESKLQECFYSFLKYLKLDFPTTLELAVSARNCYNKAHSINEISIKTNPDKVILNWLNAEFQLFKTIENDRYSTRIKTPFSTVEELVDIANTILNRRKSRAGKSLEHHLSEVFKTFELMYETQVVTEDNKRPDFLFPNQDSYHNLKFDDKKLVMLACKTTCKDRWRQILNEADRIKTKHLFTLQQGISQNQLTEMYKYDVSLVVPKAYISSFPKSFQDRIQSLESFIQYIQAAQT